jgi:NADH-quinone oxidoreductase subunit L
MPEFIWIVPAAPLMGSVLLGLLGATWSDRWSGFIGTLAVGISAFISIVIAVHWFQAPPVDGHMQIMLWRWISLPGYSSHLTFYLDPVSLVMMLVITVIGLLIHIFSTEYMAGEEGYSRFFAYLNLFVASMLLLVLANDLLVMFVGWEGVGVCSYLLVGFWFHNPANGYAARKSFVVTRIADVAMLVGILLLSNALGTLSIQSMLLKAVALWPHGGAMAATGAALLLVGGLGKSAQFPFQTWLPDAMAGPTPVSALIHAATMVTAGMYLVVRLHPLFALVPSVLTMIAVGAVITIVTASLTALVQRDIKRVLAYSTVAQIGYMFLALGVGAWSAAMFHFLTHAVFKALLFLSAGAIAMRLHHEQDIFRMGGLRRKLSVVFWAFLIGSASLAALPVVSAGAFSKEMILASLWEAPGFGKWLWLAALLGAVLTATYIFRVVFLVFFGEVKTEPTGQYGARIVVPLVLLAVGASTIGWLEMPKFMASSSVFSGFLAPVLGHPATESALPHLVTAAGYIAPLLGVMIGFGLYRSGYWVRTAGPVGQGSDGTATETSIGAGVRRFLRAGFGFDVLYDRVLVQPFLWLVKILRDDPIDTIFMSAAGAAMKFHAALRRSQIGQLRRYAGMLALGSMAVIVIMVFA